MWLTIFLREIVLYCRFHILFRLTLKKVLVGLGYWRIFNSIYYINIGFLIFVILEICFFLVVYRQKKNPIYAHVFRVIVHRIVNWKILLLTFLFPEAVFRRCSVKKLFLEILQNSQEKTCARDPFLIKLQASTLLEKSLWHRCFPVNFAKFLRTPSFTEHLRWLLLYFFLLTFLVSNCFSNNLNPFQPSAVFNIETSHLIQNQVQIQSKWLFLYMKCITGPNLIF